MKLPNKPSELILLALQDLAKARRDKKYYVDMATWHYPDSSTNRCVVCLAGSVMAFTLKKSINKYLFPDDFAQDTRDKLIALDYFRKGIISSGCRVLGIELPFDDFDDVEIPNYEQGYLPFRSAMRKLAKRFKEFNL